MGYLWSDIPLILYPIVSHFVSLSCYPVIHSLFLITRGNITISWVMNLGLLRPRMMNWMLTNAVLFLGAMACFLHFQHKKVVVGTPVDIFWILFAMHSRWNACVFWNSFVFGYLLDYPLVLFIHPFCWGCLFSLMVPMQRGHPLQDSSALHHDDCFLWQSFLGGGASDVTALSHRYFGHLWKP